MYAILLYKTGEIINYHDHQDSRRRWGWVRRGVMLKVNWILASKRRETVREHQSLIDFLFAGWLVLLIRWDYWKRVKLIYVITKLIFLETYSSFLCGLHRAGLRKPSVFSGLKSTCNIGRTDNSSSSNLHRILKIHVATLGH